MLQDLALQPLDDIKVIDVSSFLAGPFCSTQLAEFGAEVWKVELPQVGDALRRFGTITENGDSLPWLSECRNKKSITLDMRTPDGARDPEATGREGRRHGRELPARHAGEMGPGLGHLKEINPRLIMVRISGYGQTGPYRDRPGFGRIANAFGGLSFLAGYPDRPPVTPGSATIPDYMAGLYGALGALLALRARERTGRGQMIDIGLYEPIFRILDELAPAYALQGPGAPAHGARHRQRGAAQPLPDQGRALDRDRLHQRQDLRAAGRGDGPARAGAARELGHAGQPRARPRAGRPARGRMDRQIRPGRAAAHLRGARRCRAARSIPSTRSSRTRSTRRAATS